MYRKRAVQILIDIYSTPGKLFYARDKCFSDCAHIGHPMISLPYKPHVGAVAESGIKCASGIYTTVLHTVYAFLGRIRFSLIT